MEPDRNPADDHDEIDDAQLLAAIERAWPVPPMTGQLISRDWTSVAIDPQAGSFSAPLPPMSLPRFQPRRTWSSLTRVAAVLALLLTSVFGVIAFNNRSDDNSPSFSIAAPSPYESACSLPVRTRDEIVAIVTEVNTRIASGEEDGLFEVPNVSVYDLSVSSAPEVRTSIESFYDEVNDCIQSGVNPYTIDAFSSALYIPYVATELSDSNQSVEDVVNGLLSPINDPSTPTTDYQWLMPDLKVFTNRDGDTIAVESTDIFGNGFGSRMRQEGNSWTVEGYVTLLDEWSSLVITGSMTVTGCSSTSIRSDKTMVDYLQNQAWTVSALPLFAQLSSQRLDLPEVDVANEDAIRSTIEEFRQCIQAGVEPYRFAQSTEAFFGEFASFAGAGPMSPVSDLGLLDPPSMAMIVPSVVTSVVQLDENKALAVLAVDQEWKSAGKVSAIILVKVDGQWLIDQLAIVQSPPS